MTGGLRPGQVAAAAGVGHETLRYYERRGILPRPQRTDGGQPQQRIGSKLTGVERQIDDLAVIRGALRTALPVGCDDLMACAATSSCPLPFSEQDFRSAPVGATRARTTMRV